MKIQLFASDLDGTLLTSGKELSTFTREILTSAIEKGIQFVPATGRAYDSVPEFIRSFPGAEYMITSNGAAIYSLSTQKRIYEKLLDAESVDALLQIPLSSTTTYEAFIEGIPYASFEQIAHPEKYGATDYGIGYVKATRRPVENIYKFIQQHKDQLDSISLCFGNQNEMPSIKKQLLENVPNIFVTSSISHLLEIGHCQSGKGNTLKYLLNLLQIPASKAAAFGDADNDLEMLKAVKYGYIMENAEERAKLPELKQAGHNNHDGVAKIIQQFF